MKTRISSPLFLALCAAALPSCDKARNLTSLFDKKPKAASAATPYDGPLVTQLGAADYDAFPKKPGRVVIIDFHADWCGPCRELGPILDEAANQHQGLVLVGKVNVDKAKEIAAREGVSGIPDVRIYRDGGLVDQFRGYPGRDEVLRRIATHTEGLAPLPKAAQPKSSLSPMDKDWMPQGMQKR